MSGWDDPETTAYYEAFCRNHTRYRRANGELLSHSRIEPGMRVLDLAAGTGRTAEAALERLGRGGRVICVEPSAAMRAEGMRRVADSRVEWRAALPLDDGAFDRVLCGAAIWQLEPVRAMFGTLAGLLRRGGALCFNIPALYLQEPDAPGGGSDPLLLSLPARLPLSQGHAVGSAGPLTSRLITNWLRTAGYRSRSWTFQLRLTQAAYAEWLKIPVLTEGMLGGLAPTERARRIEAAMELVDRSSWKWERWRGWTAWKT